MHMAWYPPVLCSVPKQPLHQDTSIFAARNNYNNNVTLDLLTPNSFPKMGQRISPLQCEGPPGNTDFGAGLSVEVSVWNGPTSVESGRIWRNQANGIWPLLLKQAEKNPKPETHWVAHVDPLCKALFFSFSNAWTVRESNMQEGSFIVQPSDTAYSLEASSQIIFLCLAGSQYVSVKYFTILGKKALTAVSGKITMNKCQAAFLKKWQKLTWLAVFEVPHHLLDWQLLSQTQQVPPSTLQLSSPEIIITARLCQCNQ